MQISAAILAGGKNLRMGGTNKSLLEIDEKTLIDIQIQKLKSVFSEIFIVCKNADVAYSKPIVKDLSAVSCALSGIHAALLFSKQPNVFIFSCDMPFLSSELINLMIKKFEQAPCQALIPVHKHGIEPLHGIYSTQLATKAEEILQSDNYRIKNLFNNNNQIRYFSVGEITNTEISFFNINTPIDYKKAKELWEKIYLKVQS